MTKEELIMDKDVALKAWNEMLKDIDQENWLFVGTINPQMVKWAIYAIEQIPND